MRLISEAVKVLTNQGLAFGETRKWAIDTHGIAHDTIFGRRYAFGKAETEISDKS